MMFNLFLLSRLDVLRSDFQFEKPQLFYLYDTIIHT